MFIEFDDDRASNSPFIERVWHCHSERGGRFVSIASSHCELVVSRLRGQAIVTLRGPETRPTEVPCPADGEWLAIRFKVGAFMPQVPAHRLLNNLGLNLPQVSKRAFLLDGRTWELPTFDNAEAFVARLAKAGFIALDSEVTARLHGDPLALSTRSVQRRFMRVTGITHDSFRQIERARDAVNLLRQGVSIADVVWQCGYYDHPHLTRSLRQWVGLPPTKIVDPDTQLSFLYKTENVRVG